LRTSFPNKTPAISKLELVLDIYPSLSLILRYIYCLVFQGASSDYLPFIESEYHAGVEVTS
ncbi:hypothetical protein MYL31_10030, partial [Escherichia coli]|uniref:hypothetical protein n=1 Tax=Escherichia coli TaxID=562 RepID=UPI0023B26E1C